MKTQTFWHLLYLLKLSAEAGQDSSACYKFFPSTPSSRIDFAVHAVIWYTLARLQGSAGWQLGAKSLWKFEVAPRCSKQFRSATLWRNGWERRALPKYWDSCCMFLHYPFPISTCSWIGTHSVDSLEDSLFRRFFSCRLSKPRPFLPSQGLPVPYAVSARWEPSTQPGGRDSMLFCFSGINPQHSPSTDNGRYRRRWVNMACRFDNFWFWCTTFMCQMNRLRGLLLPIVTCWCFARSSDERCSKHSKKLHRPVQPAPQEIRNDPWQEKQSSQIISDHFRGRWRDEFIDDVTTSKLYWAFLVRFEEFQIPYKAPAQVQEARKLQEIAGADSHMQ